MDCEELKAQNFLYKWSKCNEIYFLLKREVARKIVYFFIWQQLKKGSLKPDSCPNSIGHFNDLLSIIIKRVKKESFQQFLFILIFNLGPD